MAPENFDAEAQLEAATLALFHELGWETADATHEVHGTGPEATLGREHRGEVVLLPRLRDALFGLNPGLTPQAIEAAIEELTRDRSAMTPVHANREIYRLLKDGVRVVQTGFDGKERVEVVRPIDWETPANNDFLLVQQLTITSDMYTKRPDLVGFVNGLPLLFGELKAHHKPIKDAYDDNLSDYKETIPHLFWYTGFLLLSNGSDARIGTLTAGWEHFSRWKRINSEGEQGIISLETLARAACTPERFLDVLENYVLYHEAKGGLQKIVAKNHQYLGVENAIAAVRQIRENQGRLGVFWHTQGAGKSFSMIFLSQKLLRKLGGNWTFVIVTDRIDLDDQIYKNFARCGAVTEPEHSARAGSGEALKRLLREDHRCVFTLIQKFGTRGGEAYPVLSERDDVIVITDEAHRSQYDVLAMNMRRALPNAAFIAFTGTPLIVGEEKTREVFGDYVSVYNFRDSVEDHATVPLYYENRVPEMELTNDQLNEDMARLLEEAELDDAQEEKLAQQFRQQYHVITRDKRLERIAEDIVEHFISRGYPGKGMVISIDKMTTVRMYDKVRHHWARKLDELRARLEAFPAGEEREELADTIAFMEQTDMAVVISQEQNEVKKFAAAGLDIVPHRRRLAKRDLDEKFKDPDDPLRLAFVCAMWRTGFDVPACSTIYLDRPMRNHTLMQTIARANRVFGDKVNGLIVDYVGIFRELQQALAIYGTGAGGGILPGDSPVEPKAALIERLEAALAAAEAFCVRRGVDLDGFSGQGVFEYIAAVEAAVERILVNDPTKQEFLDHVAEVDRLFHAILPDVRAGEFGPRRKLLTVMAEKIRSLSERPDISAVMADVGQLLDDSTTARGYVINAEGAVYDLSKIDFEALRKAFDKGHKRIRAESLRSVVGAKIEEMVRFNPSRVDFREQFQRLIDEYNQGARSVEELYEALIEFAHRLSREEQRHIAEELSEDELAVFDLLTRERPALTERERRRVKRVARELLGTLKQEKLVLDWRKAQQSRAAVQVAIEEMVWQLPRSYTEAVCAEKSAVVYQFVFDHYWGAGQSVYAA